MSFTDIRHHNWMSYLPKAAQPYAYLMRLDRPIGWWLLVLPAWWAILLTSPEITAHTVYMLGLFMLGAVIMRGAGCVVNDLWDRDLDRQVERTAQRPIASGQISVEDAVIFLLILLVMGLVILIQMPFTTIVLGVLSLPFIAVYPLMKRFTWWPQAFLGITFNFGALMGWSAISGGVSFSAFMLYVACFFWTLGYDTIYAHQDKEDDRIAGIKSTALLFGEKSRMAVFGFYSVAVILFIAVLFVSAVGWLSVVMVFLACGYGAYRLSLWQPDDAHSSLSMFKDHNRDIGLLIFLALAL